MNLIQELHDALAELETQGVYKHIRVIESAQGAYLTIGGKSYLNLSSNNYLGLASDTRIKKAAQDAIEKFGVGTTSVRALLGTHSLHVELEKKLAKFKKAEDALVVTGGYLANMAAIQTILGADDVVVSDELNHASIIDAVKLSGVKNKFIYKHTDMVDLEMQLKLAVEVRQASEEGKTRIMIITDGVFSMDGDIAPLPEIVALAEKYDTLVMVDDAHGEGVLGDHGRGIVDHFGLHGHVDIEVGTLSKAFGVMGGFITGKAELIQWYRQKARQFLFTNALSIPDTAALIAAVDMLEESDKAVGILWENTHWLKNELQKAGFDTGKTETPIIPVMLGDEVLAKNVAIKLFEQGIIVSAITFPMVSKGKARLRLQPSSLHTQEDLQKGLDAIIQCAK